MTFTFPVEQFEKVARIVRSRRKKTFSPATLAKKRQSIANARQRRKNAI